MIRGKITAEDFKIIMVEMFRRVGLTERDFENFDFMEPDWYEKHIWTEEEQDEFCKWLGKFLVDKKYVGKHLYRGHNWGEHEAGKFILNYGWKATYKNTDWSMHS